MPRVPSPRAARRAARAPRRGQSKKRSESFSFKQFWQRITEGLEAAQLWAQFKAEAEAGYRLYESEIDQSQLEALPERERTKFKVRALFWAFVNKLTPARRVALLIALACFFLPTISFRYEKWSFQLPDLHALGATLIFLLLLLEIAERVTMKRDLEVAREIQLWLLPETPPVVPGCEIAFFNRPANTVAGDYFDVLPRAPAGGSATDGCLLLAVADVAGKSLPAALLMATLQASLRTLATSAAPLAELVAGLNRYACLHSHGGLRFTTAFLAEFDPATRSLAYVNAGHCPPLLRRANGSVERLESGGLPLGIRMEAQHPEEEKRLQPGDLLVVFTDGLLEAVNEAGQEYGEQRLLTLLGTASGSAAADLLARITADLEGFAGRARQQDDVTCLLLRATAAVPTRA